MDFYYDDPAQKVRQGDIFQGLINVGVISHRFLTSENLVDSGVCFTLNLGFNYASIITPCCDIQKRDYIALCPLVILPKKIRTNAYLDEDPTRLNHMVPPEKALPIAGWDKLDPEVKQKRLEMGKTWIYINNFVFRKKEEIFVDDMVIDFNYIFYIISI